MNGYDIIGLRNEGYYTKTAYHITQTGNTFTWLCVEDSTDEAYSRNIEAFVSFK
jgi:hypothetical protein